MFFVGYVSNLLGLEKRCPTRPIHFKRLVLSRISFGSPRENTDSLSAYWEQAQMFQTFPVVIHILSFLNFVSGNFKLLGSAAALE